MGPNMIKSGYAPDVCPDGSEVKSFDSNIRSAPWQETAPIKGMLEESTRVFNMVHGRRLWNSAGLACWFRDRLALKSALEGG